jgi:hypothetical protein
MYVIPETDEEQEAIDWLARQERPEFHREETRHALLKRRLDCGHVIDGSEPYRYSVWKERGRAGVVQSRTCEPCARRDKLDWQH